MVNTGECKMNGRIARRRGVVIYDFKAIFSSETSAPCQAKLKRLGKRILEAVLSYSRPPTSTADDDSYLMRSNV